MKENIILQIIPETIQNNIDLDEINLIDKNTLSRFKCNINQTTAMFNTIINNIAIEHLANECFAGLMFSKEVDFFTYRQNHISGYYTTGEFINIPEVILSEMFHKKIQSLPEKEHEQLLFYFQHYFFGNYIQVTQDTLNKLALVLKQKDYKVSWYYTKIGHIKKWPIIKFY